MRRGYYGDLVGRDQGNTKHPPKAQDGQPLTTKNYLDPNVSSIKNEKPCTREVVEGQQLATPGRYKRDEPGSGKVG